MTSYMAPEIIKGELYNKVAWPPLTHATNMLTIGRSTRTHTHHATPAHTHAASERLHLSTM
jgi:hypothetical protein